MLWADKKEVIRGDLGERIVSEYIRDAGWVFYKAVVDGKHLVDFFCLHGDSKKLFCIEVKTKRRMYSRPYTGFDTRQFNEYLTLWQTHNVEIIFIFVDDFEQCIYSGRFSVIKDHGITVGSQTVFPLNMMRLLRRLTQDEVLELKNTITVQKDYSKVIRYFQ